MQYFLDVFQNIKTSDLNKNITVIKQEEKWKKCRNPVSAVFFFFLLERGFVPFSVTYLYRRNVPKLNKEIL